MALAAATDLEHLSAEEVLGQAVHLFDGFQLVQSDMLLALSFTFLGLVLILIFGLAMTAYLLNVPRIWIMVGTVILLGLAILTAVTQTKPRDPPAPPGAPRGDLTTHREALARVVQGLEGVISDLAQAAVNQPTRAQSCGF